MARQVDGTVLAFQAEWYDHHAQLNRAYLLKYFEEGHFIEMIDMKTKKMFLKKSPCPRDIDGKDFYVGAKVKIHGRLLTIKEYHDKTTNAVVSEARQQTCVIIKPDAVDHLGKIIDFVTRQGLKVQNLRMVKLSSGQAEELFSRHQGTPYYERLVSHLSSPATNAIVAMELCGPRSIEKFQQMVGPLRARYGTGSGPGDLEDAVEGAESGAEAQKMIDFFFGPKKLSGVTATFDSCTCCVIKPHAVKNAGVIIDAIQDQGFEVAAVEMFTLKSSEAAEFFEVYDGVLPECRECVTELCSGPCIAMELRAVDAVRAFRETAGPFDVEMAKAIRSNTLRAKFGIDKVRNAVHCTDLPEDAVSECQYFFDILQN